MSSDTTSFTSVSWFRFHTLNMSFPFPEVPYRIRPHPRTFPNPILHSSWLSYRSIPDDGKLLEGKIGQTQSDCPNLPCIELYIWLICFLNILHWQAQSALPVYAFKMCGFNQLQFMYYVVRTMMVCLYWTCVGFFFLSRVPKQFRITAI